MFQVELPVAMQWLNSHQPAGAPSHFIYFIAFLPLTHLDTSRYPLDPFGTSTFHRNGAESGLDSAGGLPLRTVPGTIGVGGRFAR